MTSSTIVPLDVLLDDLANLKADRCLVLIGVDGGGGSGKSTLARALAARLPQAGLVHIDDFYRPSSSPERQPDHPWYGTVAGFFDWPRLQRQVIEPLRNGREAAYERYDWPADSLAETLTVSARGYVVVEGISVTREELRGAYDLRVWVEAPYEVRLVRGIERDGESARDIWEKEWMPADAEYAQAMTPHEHAHLVLDGAAVLADVTTEIAVTAADPQVLRLVHERTRGSGNP
ncbi:uridine kinase family protein [Microbispora rosea]|uniref:uridine kinase family protein n=1 Tax=Microbispora rosea TaxID=58117 RepID=UPI0034326407